MAEFLSFGKIFHPLMLLFRTSLIFKKILQESGSPFEYSFLLSLHSELAIHLEYTP